MSFQASGALQGNHGAPPKKDAIVEHADKHAAALQKKLNIKETETNRKYRRSIITFVKKYLKKKADRAVMGHGYPAKGYPVVGYPVAGAYPVPVTGGYPAIGGYPPNGY